MALALMGQVVRQILHRLMGRWFLFRGRQTEQLLEAARIHDRLQQISFYRGEGLPIFYAGVRALNLAERAARRRSWPRRTRTHTRSRAWYRCAR